MRKKKGQEAELRAVEERLVEAYEEYYMDYTKACEVAGIDQDEGEVLRPKLANRLGKVENKLFDRLEGLVLKASLGDLDPVEKKVVDVGLMKWVLEKRRAGVWGKRVKIEKDAGEVDLSKVKRVTAEHFDRIREKTRTLDEEKERIASITVCNKIQ